MGISFSLKGDFIKKDEVFALQKEVERCHYALHEKTGKGNDFLGWVDLPVNYDKEEFDRIKKAAARIQANSEVLIVIGIGGSYLGARTALDFIKTPFYNERKKDRIYAEKRHYFRYDRTCIAGCPGGDLGYPDPVDRTA